MDQLAKLYKYSRKLYRHMSKKLLFFKLRKLTLHLNQFPKNISSWKGPVKIIESNSLLLAGLNRKKNMTKSYIQMLFELWQTSFHDLFPGETVPVSSHPLSEEPFPDIQSELALMQVQYIIFNIQHQNCHFGYVKSLFSWFTSMAVV